MFKRSLFPAAAAVIALTGGPLAPATAAVRTCGGECVSGSWNFGATPPWFASWWVTNLHNDQQQAFIHCQLGRQEILEFGPQRTALGTHSTAYCGSGWTGIGGGYQTRSCTSSGCGPETRHWVTGRLARAS